MCFHSFALDITCVYPIRIGLEATFNAKELVGCCSGRGLNATAGIPLATGGGILALLLRHLSFSMTGAVGFIALGGIALLNGIVMLSFINDLRRDGKSVKEAVTVATIGFIPMALSTGLGAEVQRPLVTVVIGGLITATLLTLFVLQTHYSWFEQDEDTDKMTKTLPMAFITPARGSGTSAPRIRGARPRVAFVSGIASYKGAPAPAA